MSLRLIPRLDIKGPNLVKGIHLEGLRVLGKPEDFARYYYEQGADELLYMDVVATLYGRNSLLDIISKTSREIFIPLTVGGGLRNLDDIKAVLRAGADKVTLNTAAIHNPNLIHEASRCFGSSTIVVSIEAIRKADGSYEAYTDNGREKTGLDAIAWAKKACELGAGEIMITSIDREGTGKGFDLELTKAITQSVSIPVIASGGAGSVEDVSQIVKEAHVDAVCVASLVHYDFLKTQNQEPLSESKTFSKIKAASIPEIKKHLLDQKIHCRPVTTKEKIQHVA